MSEIVSIVVPTRNSARTLKECLESIRAQSVPCTLIVVDNYSTDNTRDIAYQFADKVIVDGPERSAQRNLGARANSGEILGFIDSDMVLHPDVIEEAVAAIRDGSVGVIVPERTVGVGYWAKVREFERCLYLKIEAVEAARFFAASAFFEIGGFDEHLNAGEDWDLTLRVRQIGSVQRIKSFIDHQEGRVELLRAWKKKGSYALGIKLYNEKYNRGLLSLLKGRPWVRKPWLLLSRYGVGLCVLKAGEFAFVCWELGKQKYVIRSRSS